MFCSREKCFFIARFLTAFMARKQLTCELLLLRGNPLSRHSYLTTILFTAIYRINVAARYTQFQLEHYQLVMDLTSRRHSRCLISMNYFIVKLCRHHLNAMLQHPPLISWEKTTATLCLQKAITGW